MAMMKRESGFTNRFGALYGQMVVASAIAIPLQGEDVGNWGLQTVSAALQAVGYSVTFTPALPAVPRPVLLWDRQRHHWLCLRDTGDATDDRWEIVDSMHGICVVDAAEAAAWLTIRQQLGALAFILAPAGED